MSKVLVDFECEGAPHLLEVDDSLAPQTAGMFLSTLPQSVDLHCAKVAGNQFYWHAPFLAPYEATSDIMAMRAGSVLYWPDRQYIEVIFGDLNPEVGEINVIGRFLGDCAWLEELGRKNRDAHGSAPIFATLRLHGEKADIAPRPALPLDGLPGLQKLRSLRLDAWERQPKEIGELMQRKGEMLPFGALAFAEGEMRKLHEILWSIWYHKKNAPLAERFATAELVTLLAADRLEGLCNLHRFADELRECVHMLEKWDETFDEILKELVLYVGRLHGWLDLNVKWNALNTTTLDTGRS